MPVRICLLLVLELTITSMALNAQKTDLNEHLWQDRILIIFSSSDQDSLLLIQNELLASDKRGLADRKMVIYNVTPESIRKNGKVLDDSTASEGWYNRFDIKKELFAVILIGLDGGTKLKQNEPLKPNELFGIIDKMPMRRAELRKNR